MKLFEQLREKREKGKAAAQERYREFVESAARDRLSPTEKVLRELDELLNRLGLDNAEFERDVGRASRAIELGAAASQVDQLKKELDQAAGEDRRCDLDFQEANERYNLVDKPRTRTAKQQASAAWQQAVAARNELLRSFTNTQAARDFSNNGSGQQGE